MEGNVKGWDFTEEKPKNNPPPQNAPKKYEYDLFIHVKPNKDAPTKRKIRIRLASMPIHYGMHWQTFKPLLDEAKKKDPSNAILARKQNNPVKTPYYSWNEQEFDAAWKEGGWKPMARHASFAFDREDPHHLKILDGSGDIFNPIGEWARENNVDPAGPDGTDWVITVDVNMAGKMEIISVLPGVSTPYTEEEKKLMENNKLNINKILKISDWKTIRKMWLDLPDDKKMNPKNPSYANKKLDDDERKAMEERFAEVDRNMEEIIRKEEAEKKATTSSTQASSASIKPPDAKVDETPKDQENEEDDSHQDAEQVVDDSEPDVPF